MPNTDKSYERGQVVKIIQSVISKMDSAANDHHFATLKQEISALSDTIERLKRDIAQTGPDNIRSEKIPGATDELDAVVAATADATNTIMTACEAIESIAGRLDTQNQEGLSAHVTQIYEACGFQDITGQRITKVVSTLKEIEQRVSMIMMALDLQVGPLQDMAATPAEKTASALDPKSLMNGPQMPDKAVSQDDIDRLLAEFD